MAMVSSSAEGLFGGSAQGLVVSIVEPRAKDTVSRWQELGSRTFSMKAMEIRPPEVVCGWGWSSYLWPPHIRKFDRQALNVPAILELFPPGLRDGFDTKIGPGNRARHRAQCVPVSAV